MSARHFELIERPELIVPEAALRRRSINYSGNPSPVLTYAGTAGDSSGATGSHTYSVSFGSADPKRYILIGACILDPSVVSTIGGVAATEIYRVKKASPSSQVCAWYIAQVPTGTSGSVVVTTPGSGINWVGGIVAYSMVATNPKLIATVTSSSVPGSWPMATPAGAVAAVLLYTWNNGTWSGGVTQDANATYGGVVLVNSASTHTPTTGSISPAYATTLANISAAIAFR